MTMWNNTSDNELLNLGVKTAKNSSNKTNGQLYFGDRIQDRRFDMSNYQPGPRAITCLYHERKSLTDSGLDQGYHSGCS